MNERKRGLLQSQEEVKAEWIPLQDLSKPTNRQQHPQNNQNYTRLEDNHNQEWNRHPQGHSHSQKIEEIPIDRPFNPKIITINGDTFKQVESEQQMQKAKVQGKGKKSKLPIMHVACFYCTQVQSVPATSEHFSCSHCASQNKCTPLYRIFICGTCSAKVCYATGASDLIRCTKCSAINKVPLAHGNPYEVQYRVGTSLEREERDTDPFKEEFLEISDIGLEEEQGQYDQFNGYLRK